VKDEAYTAASALQRSMKRRSVTPTDRRAAATPLPKLNLAFWVLAALILVAICFGGGGVRYGLANLLVQLTALGILAIYKDAFFSLWKKAPLALTVATIATIALPIVQIIPLPESIWTQLPGRALAVDARVAAGAMGWAPVSLDSSRTMVAVSGLIAPLAVLAIGWSVDRESLPLAGWAIVAMGIINLAIGTPQVLSAQAVTSLYPENPMPGVLFGTFANRNSTGIFLVAALSFAALLPDPRPNPLMRPARIAICVLLLLAVVLTRSRTALALASLPLFLAATKYLYVRLNSGPSGSPAAKKSTFALVAGLAIALAALGSLITWAPGRIGDTIERFDRDGDPRSYIWEDALYSSERYWPVGSGMGTFDEVFQLDESLENMTQRRAGRAHNDYIEVAIESGAAGLGLIAVWLALWMWLSWRARLSPERWIAWSGSAVLLAIALQSITDYPLRNQSMLAVAAFALVLLARAGNPDFGKAEKGA
jgi:O-antigen ligase